MMDDFTGEMEKHNKFTWKEFAQEIRTLFCMKKGSHGLYNFCKGGFPNSQHQLSLGTFFLIPEQTSVVRCQLH